MIEAFSAWCGRLSVVIGYGCCGGRLAPVTAAAGPNGTSSCCHDNSNRTHPPTDTGNNSLITSLSVLYPDIPPVTCVLDSSIHTLSLSSPAWRAAEIKMSDKRTNEKKAPSSLPPCGTVRFQDNLLLARYYYYSTRPTQPSIRRSSFLSHSPSALLLPPSSFSRSFPVSRLQQSSSPGL